MHVKVAWTHFHACVQTRAQTCVQTWMQACALTYTQDAVQDIFSPFFTSISAHADGERRRPVWKGGLKDASRRDLSDAALRSDL